MLDFLTLIDSGDCECPPVRCDPNPHGVYAVGGRITPQLILSAYRSGIFPWPHENVPLLWFLPKRRMILPINGIHVSRSLAKTIRKNTYQVTIDRAFEKVITGCAVVPRGDGNGTWITDEITEVYTELHRHGYGHSVEVWLGESLVGGLYGLSLGACFFGESMFSTAPSASKVGLVSLVQLLARRQFHFIDCQVHTNYLASMGAFEVPLAKFKRLLEHALSVPTWTGAWSFDS